MKKTLQSIQDLRGYAVLYVMLYHTGEIFGYSLFIKGYTGVNLFFVISGFIISYVHKNDKGIEKSITFAKKRVARIYSPYFIPLLVMLVMILVSGKGGEYHRDYLNIFRNIFLIQNPTESIHPFAWSLVYEIYYYATFLLIVIFMKRSLLLYCFIMASPVIIAAFVQAVDVTQNTVPLNTSNLFFIAGALVGHYYSAESFSFGKTTLGISAAIFIAAPYVTGNPWFFLLATAQFFFVTLHADYSNYGMNFLGNASYSLYLMHAIVLSVFKTVIPYRNFFWFLVFITACIVLGSLYYVFVEKKLISVSYRWLGLARHRSEKSVLPVLLPDDE